jgi:replicative DNA helicase
MAAPQPYLAQYPGERRRVLPHNLDAEASVLGGILIRNAVLNTLDNVSTDDFYDPRHQVVWRAMLDLHEELIPIDVVTLEAEIQKTGKLEAIGGMSFLGELALRVPTPENVVHYAEIVASKGRVRRVMLAMADMLERGYQADLDEGTFFRDSVEKVRRAASHLKVDEEKILLSSDELADLIRHQARLPMIPLELGENVIETIPVGEGVYFMGNTGGGKTTVALNMIMNHARRRGPAIIASFELRSGIIGSRAAGIAAHVSWRDVLTYGDITEHAIKQLAKIDRLHFIDSKKTSIAYLRRAIAQVKKRYPGQPIMVMVDYVQIVRPEFAPIGEARANVTEAVHDLRNLFADEEVLGLCLSQMSRANAKSAREGGKQGLDTLDGGAETGAIEQSAALTLTIGKRGPLLEDGSREIEIHVGKARYGGDDRVVLIKSYGATGYASIISDHPAADVREQAKTAAESNKVTAMKRLILEAADAAPAPVSKTALEKDVIGNANLKRVTIAALVASGELVWVRHKANKHSKADLSLWTPAKAKQAGLSPEKA